MKKALAKFIHQAIVVDTRSPLIYIGTLEEILDNCIVLSSVDVHDSAETHTPKERYVMDSKVTGVKANRDRVFINTHWIISFSPLDEVKEFHLS